MPPTGHSKLGASSAHRWMKCPGSVRLCAEIEPKTSRYAEEGRLAHELAEKCLTAGAIPEKLFADQATRDAVGVYVKHVQATQARLADATMFVEQAFHLDFLDEDLWGTNDCVIDQPWGTLAVLDYKHGQGHKVDAEGNVQCLFYALGALHASKGFPHTVEIHIVQPRCPVGDPVSVWSISTADVLRWGQDELLPAALATRQPDAPLVPGEDQCRFCAAKTTCPALQQAACEAVGVAFGPVGLPAKADLEFPDPLRMTADKLGRVMDFVDLFGPWIKAVQEEAKERLIAGQDVTGWKLVEGRKKRVWKNPEEVPAKLACFGSAIWERTLLSPSQMEKAIKAEGGKLDALAGLIEEQRGATIAPVTDKRPAVAQEITAGFTAIGE